ncbi:hypothetical protein Asp14428_00500 [Actinoplanes sp. NBRC 14428]|nr:hypothetical protein Asp14428_00500 [Actinoplanes sp. NBRC 14428]
MTAGDGTADGLPEDADPLLVRPYLRDEPGAPAPDASAPTWPGSAPDPAATVVLPTPVPAGPGTPAAGTRRPRRRLVLVAGGLALLAALGVAGLVAALPPERDRHPQAFTDVSLPPLTTPASARPAPAGSSPAAVDPLVPGARPPASSPSASVTASAPVPPAPSSAAAKATTPPAAVPDVLLSSAPPALAPAPGTARTGTISGAGGLCLDLSSALPFEGNHIQVFGCNRTYAQVWTLATDGTLRVAGVCVAPADDGSVRVTGCDGRRTAQWRPGPEQSLVHLASGGCLTDPAKGTVSGSAVRVGDCTGADNQRWRLP